MKSKKNIWKAVGIAVIVGLVVFCVIYLSDYYYADMEAINAFMTDTTVERQVLDDNMIAYVPECTEVGFIFYPGGKVEYLAYEPLMRALASEGILGILIEMPFNLAVLDVNAAEGVQELFPDIERWYIGGHSLGGSMAASYLSENTDDFAGMILLGSYSTADLSEESLHILSIYGSEDKVLNQQKYSENKSKLPEDFTEQVIEGGCHAYFGMYGFQEGDGVPTISNEEQIALTSEAVAAFVGIQD